MKQYKLKSNLFVYLPRKRTKPKKFTFSLNNYKTAIFHEVHQVKKTFYQEMEEQIKALPKLTGRLKVDYTIYFGDNRKRDLMNYGSTLDKFFMDALMHYGKIDDDDFSHYIESNYSFGGIRKWCFYAEITITDLEDKDAN